MTGPKVSQLPFDLFSPSFPKWDRDGERALCARSPSLWSLNSSILTRYGALNLIYTTYPGPLWVFSFSRSLHLTLLRVSAYLPAECFTGWGQALLWWVVIISEPDPCERGGAPSPPEATWDILVILLVTQTCTRSREMGESQGRGVFYHIQCGWN